MLEELKNKHVSAGFWLVRIIQLI